MRRARMVALDPVSEGSRDVPGVTGTRLCGNFSGLRPGWGQPRGLACEVAYLEVEPIGNHGGTIEGEDRSNRLEF